NPAKSTATPSIAVRGVSAATRIRWGTVVRNNAKTLCVCPHSALEPLRSTPYCFQIIDSPLSLPIIAALQICGGSSSRAFYTHRSRRQVSEDQSQFLRTEDKG